MKNSGKSYKALSLLLVFSLLISLVPANDLCAAGFNTKVCVQKLKKVNAKENSIKLSWKKVKGSSGYQVYRAASKKGVYKKVATTKKTSYTDKKLTAGTNYFYKVRTYKKQKKSNKYGKFSKVLYVKTKKASTTQSTSEEDKSDKTTEASTTEEDKPDKTTETTTQASTEETTQASTEATTEIPCKEYRQELEYAEVTDTIANPDQGFYRPIGVKVTTDGVTYNKNIVNGSERLYHLRIDISAFSKANNEKADIPLTDAALSGVDELLSFLEEKDKSAVVRFAYAPNFGDKSDAEPELSYIVKHIEQFATVLNKYPDTITAVEFGLIGPWGEMHTSKMAGDKEAVNKLIDTYLDNVKDLPILVRTPGRIYDYLGLTKEAALKTAITAEHKAYRLGMYNDGYLGSDTDLGTYGGTTRQAEIAWIANQTSHLPYGGEVVIPGSTMHDIDNCLPEMFELHLSYINIEWDDKVIAKWKDSIYTETAGGDSLYYGKSAFAYIENHMGYRFVLTDSVLSYPEDLSKVKGSLTLKNVGFGNLNKEKKMTLLFVDASGNVIEKDAGTYSGDATITFDVPAKLPEGNYEVYLRIDNGKGKYAIRFANDLWNDELSANHIGTIRKG